MSRRPKRGFEIRTGGAASKRHLPECSTYDGPQDSTAKREEEDAIKIKKWTAYSRSVVVSEECEPEEN